MSYRLKSRKFKCLNCKETFTKLVAEDQFNVNCENCGKATNEETKQSLPSVNKPQSRPDTASRRAQLVDGAYRIVFNNQNQNNFHLRTNVRDRSLDNFHGDATFAQTQTASTNLGGGFGNQSLPSGQQNSFRTPGPTQTTKLDANYNSTGNRGSNNLNSGMNSTTTMGGANNNPFMNSRQRPPSGMNNTKASNMSRGQNITSNNNVTTTNASSNGNSATTGPQMQSQNATSTNLPRIDSRQSMRSEAQPNQQQSTRPPSGMFLRSQVNRQPNQQPQPQPTTTTTTSTTSDVPRSQTRVTINFTPTTQSSQTRQAPSTTTNIISANIRQANLQSANLQQNQNLQQHTQSFNIRVNNNNNFNSDGLSNMRSGNLNGSSQRQRENANQQSQRQQNQENGVNSGGIPQREPRMQSQQPRFNPHQQPNNMNLPGGARARSTFYRTGDGNLIHFIQFGIPLSGDAAADRQHDRQNNAGGASGLPSGLGGLAGLEGLAGLAGLSGLAGGPGGLNMNFGSGASSSGTGGLSGGLFGAPRMFVRRRDEPETSSNSQNPNNNGVGGQQSSNNRDNGNGVPPDLANIEGMLNNIMRSFQDIFSGHQFLRMNQIFDGFSPDQFMTNYNSNFFGGEDLLEMVRRMSEQEAAAQAKKRKAKADAVAKLPIVKIESKHCKKGTSGQLEAPTCTVCCDSIALGQKGMFMPCGHIYHPDCLNPWLQDHNTCPVCRFELPTEEQ